MNLTSFLGYLLYSKANYILFPLCMVFFILTEVINAIYFRILAQFDLMKNGSSDTLLNNMSDFWLFLGFLQLGYFIFCFLKYFLLTIVVLNSNEKIHKDMIYNLVRSPSSYFDTTTTGSLSSKFSNDLSVMDNILSFALIESI